MRIAKIKKSVAGCLLVMTSFLLITISVLGTEQEVKKLELVRTYQSEKEIKAAYPSIFPSRAIQDDGEHINFYDSVTGELLKQIKKEQPKPLIEEKRGQYIIATKQIYDYHISEDNAFLLYTRFEKAYNETTGGEVEGGGISPQKRVLYNAKGQKIAELPPQVNDIKLSPNQQYFLASGMYEEPYPYIYLYSIDGTLLNTIDSHGYDRVNFSQEGEFIQIWSSYGRKFLLFSKNGDLVYEGDYTKLLNNANTILYGVFMSDNGQYFLLKTSEKIHLFSINGELLWEKPSSGVFKAYFDIDKRLLQLITKCTRLAQVGEDDDFQLEIISLDSGQLLEKIEGISSQTHFVKGITIINKGGQYYEYRIQE